ncbi:MAG: DUF2062 domain-containing protein [Desulforhopalus sp.]
MNLWRINKYYFTKFKRLRGSPRALAGGTALGVFIGLTPTIPLHTLLIVFLAFVTRTSVLAGIIVSLLVCNPLTYLPIYYFSAVIGNYITPYELNLQKIQVLLNEILRGESLQKSLTFIFELGYEALVVMIIGGIVLALPFAVASYYLALRFFIKLQQKRISKRVLS